MLWASNASAYDFTVTCDGIDNAGKCGPGASFVLQKTSSAHDAIAMPLTASTMQIYLANCPSDTSCSKLVGPFFEKTLAGGVSGNWGDFAASYQNLPWSNKLTGTISSGANGGSINDVWNPNFYRNLCFSVTAVRSSASGWGIWGINYLYPAGTVMCSAPINRVAPDTCSVSTPSIDVAFGQIERSTIGTSAPAKNAITKNVSLSCTGTSTHNFSLKLNMTPASWSNSQIATSNGALGVSISKDGTLLSNGTAFDMSVLGSGTAALSFSLLKNPTVASSDIATGDFTASATLIVTEQ